MIAPRQLFLPIVVALVASGCGSTSSTSTATSSTLAGGGSPGGSGVSTTAHGTTSAHCTAAGSSIPDGTWSGPIVVDATGTSAQAGAVYNLGDGSLDITMSGGNVTAGKWALHASSEGEMSGAGLTAHITGNVEIKDGAPTGTKDDVKLNGTALITGQMVTSVGAVRRTTPLDNSLPTSAALTIEHASCDEVQASFLPDWNNKTGGRATIGGVFRWTAHRS